MGKTLGKYEIVRTLGSGAMGEVYLARQAAIGREVAIKTILPNLAKGEDAEDRFRREAEAAGRLSHPNLVTIFDFDKDGEVFFLVMEFVKGDDLQDLLKAGALSHAQYLEVLAQVCDGLGHAHRNGIIHRDIKPANVRVIRDGLGLQAKVMDFGIARMDDSSMTATGIVMGTVSYMAPEYIREGHATTQSDLFAVGVMLYECLTGRKPFAGDNTTTILFKIVSDAAPPIDLNALQGISHSIRHVLDKALSKDPAQRFQTAEAFAKALRACKDPSWTGTLAETTAMIGRHRPTLPSAGTFQEEAGTQLILAPGTATQLQPSPLAGTSLGPQAPPPVQALPGGRWSRAGRLGMAAAGILAALSAGFWFVRHRSSGLDAVPVAAAPAQGPLQPPAAAPPAPPADPPLAAPPAPGPAARARPPAQEPKKPPIAAGPGTVGTPPAEAPGAPAPKPPQAPGEPPKPPAGDARSVTALLATDPRQAAAQAKALVAGDPGSAELQGLYLAALYQSRNAWAFERGLSKANAEGVTVKKMIAASSAFKAALVQESRLQRASPASGVLSPELLRKISDAL